VVVVVVVAVMVAGLLGIAICFNLTCKLLHLLRGYFGIVMIYLRLHGNVVHALVSSDMT